LRMTMNSNRWTSSCVIQKTVPIGTSTVLVLDPFEPSLMSYSDLFDTMPSPPLIPIEKLTASIGEKPMNYMAKTFSALKSARVPEPSQIRKASNPYNTETINGDEDDLILDKFRFKFDQKSMRKAIESRSAITASSAISSTEDTSPAQPQFIMNSDMLELLEKAEVEESGNTIIYHLEVDYDDLPSYIKPIEEDSEVTNTSPMLDFQGSYNNGQTSMKMPKSVKNDYNNYPADSLAFLDDEEMETMQKLPISSKTNKSKRSTTRLVSAISKSKSNDKDHETILSKAWFKRLSRLSVIAANGEWGVGLLRYFLGDICGLIFFGTLLMASASFGDLLGYSVQNIVKSIYRSMSLQTLLQKLKNQQNSRKGPLLMTGFTSYYVL